MKEWERERAAAAGGRNGLAGRTRLRGKNKAEQARIREREKKIKKEKNSFLFLEHIFKSKFKSNLISFEILIKPNHHKINMQQHVCTNKLLNLYLIFILTKFLFF